jgi:hypothetical protein
VVALAVGWWLDRTRLAARAAAAHREAARSQAQVEAVTRATVTGIQQLHAADIAATTAEVEARMKAMERHYPADMNFLLLESAAHEAVVNGRPVQ